MWVFRDNNSATFITSEYGEITISREGFNSGGLGLSISDINRSLSSYHEGENISLTGIPYTASNFRVAVEALQIHGAPGGLRGVAVPVGILRQEFTDNGVVNLTKWAHVLDPGIVLREIVVVDGQIAIRTVGIGNGWFGDLNEDLMDPLWSFVDGAVVGRILGNPDFSVECFPAGTSITTGYGSLSEIESIYVGDQVSVLDATSTGTVTQIFRNITTEWLEIVWVNPTTGAAEQIISTPGHRFLKPDGGYDRIIDMVDRSAVCDAANDNHDVSDNSFGGTHPFSAGVERPFGVGPDEQIVSDAWVALGTADIVLQGGTVVTAYVRSIQYCEATAHLFEEGEMVVTRTEGGLACKPEFKRGWKTYNFEVAEHHNYIANGVHVHNDSTFATSTIPWATNVTFSSQGVYDVYAGTAAFGTVAYTTDDAGIYPGYVTSINGNDYRVNSYGVTSIIQPDGTAIPIDYDIADSNGNGILDHSFGGIGGALGAVGNAIGGFIEAVAEVVTFGAADTRWDEENGSTSSSAKPILIDLDGDGVEVLPQYASSALFDFDDDGFLERTAWVGADDGILVFDENDDGQISSALEIAFAEWTEEDDTDLQALAANFDTNGDGIFDADDDQWDQFRIWRDENSNGEVDDGELMTLAEADITAISLSYNTDEAVVLDDGTVIHGLFDVMRGDGETLTGGDVALRYALDGVAITQDADGNDVYSFEAGEDARFRNLDETTLNFDLGGADTDWVGAAGNALDNVLDGTGRDAPLTLIGNAGPCPGNA